METESLAQMSERYESLTNSRAIAANSLATYKEELTRLDAEIAPLKAAMVKELRKLDPPVRKARGAYSVARIDWSEVLVQLPDTFNAHDIRGVCVNANDKPASQLFSAINRWIKAGVVRKSHERGVYVKIAKEQSTDAA